MTPKVSEDEVLQTLRPDNLVLSSGNSCIVVSRVVVIEDLNLSSDYKEADTKSLCIVQMPFTEIMGRMYSYGPHVATQT